VALALFATFAAICLAWFLATEHEPRYGGRALSEWLTICRGPDTPRDLREEATAAVRKIGTNGLPYLLAHASGTRPGAKHRIAQFLDQYPTVTRLTPRSVSYWLHSRRDQTKVYEARLGFVILAPGMTSAIPDLVRIAMHPSGMENSFWAVDLLGEIGPPALPALLTIITNSSGSSRSFAVCQLPKLGTNATPALPTLIRCLDAPDPQVAYFCATALGTLKLDQAQCVPALLHCVRSGAPPLRYEAARAILQFGTAAWPVIPELRAVAARETDFAARHSWEYEIERFERTTPRNP